MFGRAEVRKAALAALLSIPAAAQQIVQGDFNLLHHAPAAYPAEAAQKGIEGAVVVEATLNGQGNVIDARVTSGPPLLRKSALQSILEWHYAPGTPSPQQVVIEFRPEPKPVLLNGQPMPEGAKPIPAATPAPRDWDVGVLKLIDLAAVSPATRETVLNRLPVREGDSLRGLVVNSIDGILREIDEHLISKFVMLEFDGERRQYLLRISYNVPAEMPPAAPHVDKK